MKPRALYLLLALSLFTVGWLDRLYAQEAPTIRVGVLKFGTLNWEMDIIRRHQLAEQSGLNLEVVPLASTQALLVALQGGAVDAIIGDWIWAARQREHLRDYYFYPYSTAAGSLVVNPALNITSFEQLRGQRIGVAGGEVNKNWNLFRAYARTVHGLDLAEEATIKFAAPPMLNALLLNERLDAVINFWHYSSELNEQGMPTLITMQQLMKELGVSERVPLLGWLFPQRWADQNREVVELFLKISYSARQLMLTSDSEWLGIKSMQHVTSDGLRARLRDAYRQGIPRKFGNAEKMAMQHLFSILREESGTKLAGNLTSLPEDIFWTSSVLEQ